jgi:predicted nucleic acid-binding protein
MTRTLLDAGPLVAYLNVKDRWHEWAQLQFQNLRPPLLTCEAALAEACFLVQRNGGKPSHIMQLLQRGVLISALNLNDEAAALESLMKRYSDTPMSLADGCLVRLSEIHSDCRVFTLDSDFTRYRRNGRQIIPLLAPW